MNDDGSMPFEVLPIDPIRQRVRDVAFSTLALSGILFFLDEFDLLPWDACVRDMSNRVTSRHRPALPLAAAAPCHALKPTHARALCCDRTVYHSLEEREAAQEARARGEPPADRYKKKGVVLLEALRAKLDKRGSGDTVDAPSSAKKAPWSFHGPGLFGTGLFTADKAKPAKRAEKQSTAGSIERDEALKRVLGLTTWDAAAELKAKVRQSERSPF